MSRVRLLTKNDLNFGVTLKGVIDKFNESSKKYIVSKDNNCKYRIEKIVGFKEYEYISNLPFSELQNVTYEGDLSALIYIYVSKKNKETLNGRWNKIKRGFKKLWNNIKEYFNQNNEGDE